MSATIRWRPTGDGHSLPTGAPSIFWDTLTALTQSSGPEIKVEAGHAPGMKALIASNPFQAGEGWKALIEAVEKHGSVIVWRDW